MTTIEKMRNHVENDSNPAMIAQMYVDIARHLVNSGEIISQDIWNFVLELITKYSIKL